MSSFRSFGDMLKKNPDIQKRVREGGFPVLSISWDEPTTSGSVDGETATRSIMNGASMASLSSDEEDATRRCIGSSSFRSTNHEQLNGCTSRKSSHNSPRDTTKKNNNSPKSSKFNVVSNKTSRSHKYPAPGMKKNIRPTMPLLEDNSSSEGESENYQFNTHLGDGSRAFRNYKSYSRQNPDRTAHSSSTSTTQGPRNSNYVCDPYLSAEQFRMKWGHRGEFDDQIDSVQYIDHNNYTTHFGHRRRKTNRFGVNGNVIICVLVSILVFSVLFVIFDQSGKVGLFSAGTPGKLSECDGKDVTVTGKAKCEARNDFIRKEMYAKTTLKGLHEAVSSAYCNEGIENKPISQEEIARYLAKEHNIPEQDALWQLRSVLQMLEDVLTKSNDGFLTLKNFPVPWTCLMYNWFSSTTGYIIRFITGCLVIVAFYMISRWRAMRRKNIEKEISPLTDNVITLLQQNVIGDDYVVISNVRDQFIPPQYREQKKDMWNEVRRQVAESMPHLKEETKLIDGELVEVWSLMQDDRPATRKLRKVWQGEAFGTSEGSINCPVMSPTECLKVRHMFDPISELSNEEDWAGRVKDAILERCEGMKILHMAVDEDSNEGCVYLKCDSQEDAGEVYKKIHGVWFDGRIISAKYLRLKRYLERFPEAASATVPLKPSNDLRLSMRNC